MNPKELSILERYTTESLASFMPYVQVTEKNDMITVGGFNSTYFEKDLKKVWGTSRIYGGIFLSDGFRYVRFHTFYAIEFVYILSKLLDTERLASDKSTLRSALAQMYKNTWLKNTRLENHSLNFNYGKLNEIKQKPFEYQMAFLKNFETVVPQYGLKGYLAELAAGSGKTLLAYFFSLISESDLTIILAPKPTISQIWVDTLENSFMRPQPYWESLNKGTITGDEKYVICHHQALDILLENIRKLKRRGRITIWIDESHKMTEESSGLVQKLYKLVEELEPDFTIHASATPLKARPTEAIPLLKTIDPKFKGEAVKNYTKTFGASKAVALDILNNRLGVVKFKITKEQYSKIEETDKELKVRLQNSIDYELDTVRNLMVKKAEEYIAEYKELKPMIVNRFNDLHNKVLLASSGKDLATLSRYKKYADKMHRSFSIKDDLEILRECKEVEKQFHLIILTGEDRKEFKALAPMYKYPVLSIRGKLLGNVLGKQRIACFKDMAVNMELEKPIDAAIKKTVIFTSYVDVAKAAYDYCVAKGYKPLIVNQETNHMLPQILKKAENDPEANPIIATYQSLGTGNELVMCSTYIALDVPYRAYIQEQARARINRASQDTSVTYYEAVLDTGKEPNLSTRNMDILAWSKDQVDQMLGTSGDGMEVDEDIGEETLKGFR